MYHHVCEFTVEIVQVSRDLQFVKSEWICTLSWPTYQLYIGSVSRDDNYSYVYVPLDSPPSSPSSPPHTHIHRFLPLSLLEVTGSVPECQSTQYQQCLGGSPSPVWSQSTGKGSSSSLILSSNTPSRPVGRGGSASK